MSKNGGIRLDITFLDKEPDDYQPPTSIKDALERLTGLEIVRERSWIVLMPYKPIHGICALAHVKALKKNPPQ